MPNQSSPTQASFNPIGSQDITSPPTDIPPMPLNTSNPQGGVVTPTSPASSPNLPPVITPPKKKFGGGKIIATILGILLLVGGVGAGIFLTQQQQDIREKAYTGISGPVNICSKISVSATEKPQCGQNCSYDEEGIHCSGKEDIGNVYETFYKLTNLTSEDHSVEYTKYSYYCPRFKYGDDGANCLLNESKETQTVTVPANQSVTIEVKIEGLLKNGASCGTYQTDFKVHSIDGDANCHNGLAFGVCRTGRDCQAEWTPPPTLPPSPTPPSGSGQCLSVFAVNSTGAELTGAQLAALTPGTDIYFCTRSASSGGSFDKAQFKVGSTVYPEIIFGDTGSGSDLNKCQKYQIKTTDTKVDVKAKLHHTISGWVGETF